MKQHIVRIALGLAVVALFLGHAAEIYQIKFLDQLDNIIYDARLKLTAPNTKDDKVVILDIDEKSLGELGRWPWSRDKMATLVTKLFDKYGIVILGFDVVFAEPDTSSGLGKLQELAKGPLKENAEFQDQLGKLKGELDYDARFAAALKGKPVVLGFYFSSAKDAQKSGVLPEPVLPSGTFKGKPVLFPQWLGYGANIDGLLKNAMTAGTFNPILDSDGSVRRVPMISEYDGQYFESLSLAMYRALLGSPKLEPGYPPGSLLSRGYTGLEWLELNVQARKFQIPVDRFASAYVPYRGKGNVSGGSFDYISLADVYSEKVDPARLKGKYAIWGTTAPGLLDLRNTPMGEAYPGVEIHANLLSGMITQNFREKPAYIVGAEVMLLVIGGLGLAFLMPLLSPLRATIVAVTAMIAVVLLNFYGYKSLYLIIPLASSLLMTIALFALNMSYGYFIESRGKRELANRFGEYVPPELVDEMAKNPEKYNMQAKNEDLTILFSDIRGFTTISESLSPADLSEYINEYLTTMSLVIRKNRGTLDKYIGDAIMAFWGAPVADPDHARNGVTTGLAMQLLVKELDDKFRKKGWPTIKIGIGLNSGNVRVGDMGSKIRRAYTVMGDAVNLASRLEGRTKYYGVGLMVGEATRNLVKDVVYRELDRIRVKGKDEPVTVYEPIGMEGQLDKRILEELKLWHQTIKIYRLQQWDQVDMNLLNLQRQNPNCYLYEHYAEQVVKHRRNPPPPNWDGVTSFDEK